MSRLLPGVPVVWQNRKWILLDIPAVDRILVRDPITGHTELAPADEVQTVMGS
jgi:putative transposase